MSENRRFYGAGDAKGFTKAKFFQTVQSFFEGEDIDNSLEDLVIQACVFELESLSRRRNTTDPDAPKKDPLQSDYANAIRAAVLPLIDGTPRTCHQFADMIAEKGILPPVAASGKNKGVQGDKFHYGWIARVLKKEPGVVAEEIIVTVQAISPAGKPTTSQKAVTGYRRSH